MAVITISFENEEPHEFIISRASARAVWTLLTKQSPTIKRANGAYNQGVSDVKELLKRGYTTETISKLSDSQIREIAEIKE